MARTKKAKNRGRPRKDGPREPSGRPSRAHENRRQQSRKQQMETMDVVLTKRCRIMGWRATEENKRAARAQELGSAVGRLHAAGHISRRAYLGILAYERLEDTYRRLIGLPPRAPATMPYDDSPRGRDEYVPPRDLVMARASEWMDAEGALDMAGRAAGQAVRGALFSGLVPEPAPLESGGLALAAHFKVEE